MGMSDRLANIGPLGPPDFNGGLNNISSVLSQILPYLEQSRDSELRRKKELLNFQGQNRLGGIAPGGNQQEKPPMNVVFNPGPQMTPYEKAEVGLREKELGLRKDLSGQALTEKSKEYENKMKQKDEDQALAQKKEQDIHDQKLRESQAKADKIEKELEFKNRELAGKQGNFQDRLELQRLQLEAAKAQHEVANAQRDAREADLKRKHEEDIAVANRRAQTAEDALKQRTEAANAPVEQSKSTEYEGGFNIPLIGNVGGHKVQKTTTTKGGYSAVPEPKSATSDSEELAKDPRYWDVVNDLMSKKIPLSDANIKQALGGGSSTTKSSSGKTREMAIAELTKRGRVVNEDSINLLLKNPNQW